MEMVGWSKELQLILWMEGLSSSKLVIVSSKLWSLD